MLTAGSGRHQQHDRNTSVPRADGVSLLIEEQLEAGRLPPEEAAGCAQSKEITEGSQATNEKKEAVFYVSLTNTHRPKQVTRL